MPNQRWSLDFLSDQLTDGHRFRILIVVDDCIQKERRNRALPYFEMRLWPRNMSDWTVARSMPQNFKNCLWWRKRRR
jgi:hypothetical protein